MDDKSPLISYVLATLCGICFVSGLAMSSDKGGSFIKHKKKTPHHWRGIVKYIPLI